MEDAHQIEDDQRLDVSRITAFVACGSLCVCSVADEVLFCGILCNWDFVYISDERRGDSLSAHGVGGGAGA